MSGQIDPEIAAAYDVPPDKLDTIDPEARDLVTRADPTERDVKTLAHVLFSLMQESWTTTTLARAILTSDWYAERIAEARREGAAEVAERVEVSLADSLGGDPLGVRIAVRAALRGDA